MATDALTGRRSPRVPIGHGRDHGVKERPGGVLVSMDSCRLTRSASWSGNNGEIEEFLVLRARRLVWKNEAVCAPFTSAIIRCASGWSMTDLPEIRRGIDLGDRPAFRGGVVSRPLFVMRRTFPLGLILVESESSPYLFVQTGFILHAVNLRPGRWKNKEKCMQNAYICYIWHHVARPTDIRK